MHTIWAFLLQTLSVSLVAAVLLLIKRLMADKLSPRWQYGIWSLLALRIVLPVSMQRHILLPLPLWLETGKMCIRDSSYGRAYKAIRDDEIAAEAMGINLFKHKQQAFMISSFFAGVSGALLAMFQTTVTASTFRVAMTYEILLIVVIGGMGSISGSVIGSFLYIACSEWWLRFLDQTQFINGWQVPLLRTGFRKVVFAVIIMIIVLFFRKGLMGDRELSVSRIRAGLHNLIVWFATLPARIKGAGRRKKRQAGEKTTVTDTAQKTKQEGGADQ